MQLYQNGSECCYDCLNEAEVELDEDLSSVEQSFAGLRGNLDQQIVCLGRHEQERAHP